MPCMTSQAGKPHVRQENRRERRRRRAGERRGGALVIRETLTVSGKIDGIATTIRVGSFPV